MPTRTMISHFWPGQRQRHNVECEGFAQAQPAKNGAKAGKK